ncbi:MAG: hypothetical protein IJU79_00690 [Desulfovibrionaceae bacterium]|nr:hypothetical protein [Desulfovibrionaceae bacterium]
MPPARSQFASLRVFLSVDAFLVLSEYKAKIENISALVQVAGRSCGTLLDRFCWYGDGGSGAHTRRHEISRFFCTATLTHQFGTLSAK